MLEQLGYADVVAICPPCQHGALALRCQALASLRCSLGDGAVVERCVNASCITPDSCGKAGDPHNLETGALAACAGHISMSRRRALDKGWDVAAQTAGESKGHPVDLD